MKRHYIGKPFKPISKFYCYNCHGFGRNVVDCKKPKFDSNNANRIMFRNTNPTGSNGRGRSHCRPNDNGERR